MVGPLLFKYSIPHSYTKEENFTNNTFIFNDKKIND
jgi:hypothetical protein